MPQESPKKRKAAPAKSAASKKAAPTKKVVTKQPPKAAPLKPPPVAMPTPGSQTVVLDALGVEGLCALIEDGHSLRQIAKELSMEASTLTRWIAAEPQRSARVRESRIKSAETYAEKAETVLMEATTAVEVARARELASHYRWVAKTRNPKEFGDKVQVEGEVKVTELSDADLDTRIATLIKAVGIPGLVSGAEGATSPAA